MQALQKLQENALFSENSWQKFYTTAGRNGRDTTWNVLLYAN